MKICFTKLIKNLFLSLLVSLSFNNFAYSKGKITEAEVRELEAMAQQMLDNLPPKEREQALAMAKQMENEIASLPPEQLAQVEEQLKSEVDKMLDKDTGLRNYLPPRRSLKSASRPKPKSIKPKKPASKPKQKVTKKSNPTDPQQIALLKELLKLITKETSSILLKTDSLPRVSSDLDTESAWQLLKVDFNKLKSLAMTFEKKEQLIKELLKEEHKKTHAKLNTLGDKLKISRNKLLTFKNKEINKISETINDLLELEIKQMTWELRKILKSFKNNTKNSQNDNSSKIGDNWGKIEQKTDPEFIIKSDSPEVEKPMETKLSEKFESELSALQEAIKSTNAKDGLINLLDLNDLEKTDSNKALLERKAGQLEANLFSVSMRYDRAQRAVSSILGKSSHLEPSIKKSLHKKMRSVIKQKQTRVASELQKTIRAIIRSSKTLPGKLNSQIEKLARQHKKIKHDLISIIGTK